ncbi:N-ethylmaleimide reductase [Amycolatopsis mediterranei S699]|uniref:N-ethylmaleimide reductase n=2 Tax=Amycolatopsis mediterranei TaxID=33910 RepID=A0A0H3CXL1_AMYMU|nr:alkene reductase [Amycolatopsis mediterranei]ADJ42785.1 N-ethylmaleimide reductase [Amycolatopsis mediterranei U32]AEK39476.1 N-ethylmaleimide reductase [Amycolatopsis mediterranei S699]AFO74499.1 N-ethylmaleimide reductase [Amycolatopsis mediterranei S699]AGT81628.1 N-ethylmaleimide reductase [Amycolatopsis mediterranei RB]KDO09915.1 1,2-oxophytodienoate reductase [Amycolatopsis mediterranei]
MSLLTPADLGGWRLPNRVVLAPTTRARVPGGVPGDLQAAYYAQRAGAGLIVAEGTWVSERAIGFSDVPGIYTEAQVAGWRRVTDVVHALGGRIVLQLWHTGAVSHPDFLGGQPAGPSAVNPDEPVYPTSGQRRTVTPREMSVAEIRATVRDYGAAAEKAHRAGFDGVEVAANGVYLLAQFLHPRLNHRTDAYGGSPAARRRFLTEVVDAAAAHGRVGVRLSPWWTGGLFTVDEALRAEYDELVAGLAVDYLHLRGPDTGQDFAAFARYRTLFDGPMVVNNGFDRKTGNAVIEAGIADAVSFARHFIANPDLVTRFALGLPIAPADPATYYGGGAAGYVEQTAAMAALSQ